MIKSVATSFEISSAAEIQSLNFNLWLTDFAYGALALKGFFSAEIIPPGLAPTETEQDQKLPAIWSVIHRFDSEEACSAWLNSTERKSQLDGLASEFQGQVKECAARASLSEHGSSVVAIETYVAPGKEDRYFQWKRKLEATQSSFPGYKGSYLQAPVPGRDNYWSSILHFGGTDALEFWLHSEQRLALVAENEEFEAATRLQVIGSTFPGWEPTITGKPVTPAWKTACLVVLALYPILVVQRHYFVPLLNGLNMALAVAISSLCSVGVVSFICMPTLVKKFTWWLLPSTTETAQTTKIERIGTTIVLAIFLLEVVVLSYLVSVLK